MAEKFLIASQEHKNIIKVPTGKEDVYTTSFLFYHANFKE